MKEHKITSTAALKRAHDILEENGWENGYSFRHSDLFFINKLNVSVDKKNKKVLVNFNLEYKTKSRLVVNNVTWAYDYNRVHILSSAMENLEKSILMKTSDPDRTDQVFGPRFNRVLFKQKNYAALGWVIKK